ncbi:hexosaminidase [Agromyces sp. CF514]|uniref:beta-N-acetylhexosaminidase n=1 Tax=Agromyces sp. CF514 TaxID=1881031 RepID=UPI0008F3486F|nr:beta-N-acetylhexosaminidase [Agromyces sp. CF514]SFR82786.1 hexosaminidase [Agromyces sp. CF514]
MTTTRAFLPRPQHVAMPEPLDAEAFVLDRSTSIAAPRAVLGVAEWLAAEVRPATGLPMPVVEIGSTTDASASGGIRLSLDAGLAEEAYRVRVTRGRVEIAGGGPAGVFRGATTLLQLLPADIHRRARVDRASWALAAVEVADAPRFGWRGTMLDVVRHFMPKHDLMRFIDLMARHKLNVLHLHLTDDQGWRMQIHRYPRLTEVGGWRHESQVGADPDGPGDGRPHGGFYTQDDLREIVAYAAERFVTIVPEIESPGHVQAALAAYPELGVRDVEPGPLEVWPRWGIDENVLNAEESTVQFFLDVFDEVMEVFPSTILGVGGDECPRDQWRESPRVQQRMRELGLADEASVQSWFIGRIAAHLAAHGRRVFGWEELLEGELAGDAVIASWRGASAAAIAARLGYDLIACPDDVVYLDYRQSDAADEPIPVSIPITVLDAYRFDPVPPGLDDEGARHVLGGQANIWTEYMDSSRTVDFFAFPRLCAIAEVLWSGPGGDETDFTARLEQHLDRLAALGVEYRRATGPMPWQRRPGIPGRPETREERSRHVASLLAGLPGA